MCRRSFAFVHSCTLRRRVRLAKLLEQLSKLQGLGKLDSDEERAGQLAVQSLLFAVFQESSGEMLDRPSSEHMHLDVMMGFHTKCLVRVVA